MKYYTEGSSGFVDIKDVVKGMVSLMESDIKNERFVLVSENLTYKEFLGGLSVALGKPAPSKSISKRTLLFLSSLDWLSSNLFGTKRRLLKGIIHSMFRYSKYDASKIEKALDFQFTPYEETITRIVKNYKA